MLWLRTLAKVQFNLNIRILENWLNLLLFFFFNSLVLAEYTNVEMQQFSHRALYIFNCMRMAFQSLMHEQSSGVHGIIHLLNTYGFHDMKGNSWMQGRTPYDRNSLKVLIEIDQESVMKMNSIRYVIISLPSFMHQIHIPDSPIFLVGFASETKTYIYIRVYGWFAENVLYFYEMT